MEPQRQRPLALVSNDDGVDAPFLRLLVEALTATFEVAVAAPAGEQSWIGRCVSRRARLEVEPVPWPGARAAWAITGTPTDAVNIALSHLLDRAPDVVISGINVGQNCGWPLILSSGTLAAALEGALWGHPAIAASQQLPADTFSQLGDRSAPLPEAVEASVRQSAAAVCACAHNLLAGGAETADVTVHNLNFPFAVTADAPLRETRPQPMPGMPLYAREASGHFCFSYPAMPAPDAEPEGDRAALQAGCISHSILNFGPRPNV